MTKFNQRHGSDRLRIISLGGSGSVTKNMYVYEHGSDILVVDCGIGFPGEEMLGVDLVIPDISYLRDKKRKVRGIVLTHGHDDHIAGLPYILPELSCPVYGSKLTAGLAEERLAQAGVRDRVSVIDPDRTLSLGVFKISFVRVTHSIPDALNLIIQTPVGTIFHASDFKFDWTPVMGGPTEVAKIARAGDEGILALLSDCVRVEKPGYTLSEATIEDSLERELRKTRGKFIVTTMSSNISRLKTAIEVATRRNRKVALVGRSIIKNMEVAQRLGFIRLPGKMMINPEKARRLPANQVALMVAGSQAQVGSSLYQAAAGEHRSVQISSGDKVVFSSDHIPGNEAAIHALIDALTHRGAEVSYQEILDDLHVSGHSSQAELSLMIGLTRPQYVMPIGGTYRHMVQYGKLAESMGIEKDKVILPDAGQVVALDHSGRVSLKERVEVRNVMVDGLGVGDVGQVVLRDRQVLAEEGVVVVIVPVDQTNFTVSGEPDIVSRGFVYVKGSEKLFSGAREEVKAVLAKKKGKVSDWRYLRKEIEGRLEEYFYDLTQRRPMILPVVVEV